MIDREERERREQEIKARLDRFPVISKEAIDRDERRIALHLAQKSVELKFTDKEASEHDADQGNEKVFGQKYEIAPTIPGNPWRLEARYPIFSVVEKNRMRTNYITLRVWEDIDLGKSISLNIDMAKRVSEDNLKKDALLEIMTCTVVMWLRLRGRFFWLQHQNSGVRDSAESMYFDGKDRKLRQIVSGEFKDWLYGHSGINPANKRAWDQMMESIKTTSTNPDIAYPCVPGNLFDRRGNCIYISCGESSMIKVSPGHVDIVDNGTDGVVFAFGKTLAPWTLLDEGEGVDPFEKTQLFGGANFESIHGRMILRLWFLSLAGCIKNYPALLLVGRYRSGKSRTAQGILELLGVPTSLGAIRDNGEDDFWANINNGGVACFDNVDSSNKWIGDAMQLACTGGSTTKRKLFTDDQLSVLEAKAKIMLTSNNPMFASVSGLADRLQTVFLGPFTAKAGKESKDSELTEEIVSIRDASFTWMAYTLSRALSDSGDIAKNVNRRHPDFAAFALRCARAIGKYEEGLAALQCAEFSKSVISLQNDRLTNMIFESLRKKITEDGSWTGTSSAMLELIKANFETDEYDKMLSNRAIGKVLMKHIDELLTCFTGSLPKTMHGRTQYHFNGFTEEYKRNMSNVSGNCDIANDCVDDVVDTSFP